MTSSKGYASVKALSAVATAQHISNLNAVITKLNLDVAKDTFGFQFSNNNTEFDAVIYCNIKGKANDHLLSFKVYDKVNNFVQWFKQPVDKSTDAVLTVTWELSTMIESLEPFGANAMNAEDL